MYIRARSHIHTHTKPHASFKGLLNVIAIISPPIFSAAVEGMLLSSNDDTDSWEAFVLQRLIKRMKAT